MSTMTVRASEHSHAVLRQLSQQEGISLIEALDKITTEWERLQFFRSVNASFAALRSDPDAWAEEQEERRLWAQTLNDGLTDDNQTEPR